MFVPVAAKIVSDLIADGHLKPGSSVIEMGNQTNSIGREALLSIIDRLKKSDKSKSWKIKFNELETLAGKPAAKKPKQEGVPEVKDFFSALGFSSYQSIDINSDFGSLVMDLNKDIKADYGYDQHYDLVTNIGVSEHLLNQANFIKNAHTLAKPGGVMLHILPFWGYVNHGFFNYQPRLFLDLAAANNYNVLGLYLSERDRTIVDLTKPTELLREFYNYLGLLISNDRQSGFVVAILKKRDESEFVLPLQGKYIPDLSAKGDVAGIYSKQSISESVAVTKGFFAPTKSPSLKLRVKIKLLKMLTKIERLVLLS